MIRLPFYISAENLTEAYQVLRGAMSGNENIIFEAMATVTARERYPFTPPASIDEYEQKHRQIEERLKYPVVSRGIEMAMRLMEEIMLRVNASGGVGRHSADDLRDLMQIPTATPRIVFVLTQEHQWAARWNVVTHMSTMGDLTPIHLDIYSSTLGEIVPSYVIKYVDYSIMAYQERTNSVALALSSIAIEATLRDVLDKKGYSYKRREPLVDLYETASAEVGISGNAYTVTFMHPMPLSLTDFLSAHGNNSVKIQIRRNITREGRVDLLMINPQALVDYWSSNTIAQPAAAKEPVGGLGAALNIARRKEMFLDPTILPEEFDDVIQIIRNNLVHLSGEALNTHLPMFDYRSLEKHYTLQNFLNDEELVFDFIRNVPQFITDQYNKLRRNNP